MDLTGNFVVNGHKNCENNEGSLDENVESVAEFIKNSQSLNGVVTITKGVNLILKTLKVEFLEKKECHYKRKFKKSEIIK